MTMTERKIQSAWWIVCTAIFLLVVHGAMTLYFYKFYQRPSLEYIDQPFAIDQGTREIKAGESVIFHVERCSEDDYGAVVNIRMVDTIVWDFAPRTAVIQKGCTSGNRIVEVPKNIPPAIYMIEGETIIEVRWFYFHRIDVIHFETYKFTVVK